MYRHILIPTDGSELVSRAARHGLALAKSVGAKVTALTVERSFESFEAQNIRDDIRLFVGC
jgi:nucleotide-binding universal stress UspA family protein